MVEEILMEELDEDWDDGRRTEARFCQCGRALVCGTADDLEWMRFDEAWYEGHSGPGHREVTFAEWLAICLPQGRQKVAA